MPDRTHHVTRRVSRGSLSVTLVLALAGMMFVANARLAHGTDERHPQNLADLRKVEGLTLDKVERFGPAIVELCTT